MVQQRQFVNTLIRQQFEIPKGIYLASHSTGCMPIQARQMLNEFFSAWGKNGPDAWETWLYEIELFQKSLATLLGGKKEEYCPQVNISSALTKIIGALPKRKGRKKIITSSYAFSTIGFVLEKSIQHNYTLEFAHQTGLDDSEAYWDRLLTEEVEAIVLMHGYSNLGCLSPITDIAKIARKRGIFTIVDIAQTAGVIPIKLSDWGINFVIGSSLKWLCGGPGASFLWCDQEHIGQFQPTDVGWFSHADPFEMDIQDFRYHDSAQRFWGGTPSVLPYLVARTGIDLINTIGIEKIYAHNQMLLEILLKGLQKLDARIISPISSENRSATCIVDLDNRSIVDHLFKKYAIITDYREGYRISPHLYNTKEEMLYLIDLLATVKDSGLCQAELS